MNAVLISLAVAMLGHEVGWQPLREGGMEYIIQLETEDIQLLQDGKVIRSDILAEAGNVRSYCIYVDRGLVKRVPPRRADTAQKPVAQATATPAENKEKPVEKPPADQWLSLSLSLLGLFASLGANVFLGWIICGQRRQCRASGQ